MRYIKKSDLYKMVSQLREYWEIEESDYNLDMKKICQNHGIKIGAVPFKKSGLRGIASVGINNAPDVIVLNSYRNSIEQNIDCSHEAIHLAFHRNLGCESFNCFETALPSQNKYLEWQANEGAAELLVPYKTLLPKIKHSKKHLSNYLDIFLLKEELAREYNVSDAVISYRLESLKFEINQFVNGISIQDLSILSCTSQQKKGMQIKSLNDIAFEDLSNDYEALMYDENNKIFNPNLIVENWSQLIQKMGGLIKASFRDTILENKGENCFCINFSDLNSFLIGNRETILNELKQLVLKEYNIEVVFLTKLILT